MSLKEQPSTDKKQPWRSEMMRDKWADPEERQAMIAARMGHFVSPATREKIGNASRGRKHTEAYKREMSQERGAVRIRAYPLLLRGGIAGEVARITGLKKTQVQNLRSDLRKRGELKKPTKEESNQAKRKAHLKLDPSQEGLDLAKKFLKAVIVTTDLTFWNALLGLYHVQGRILPENLSDQLRLEVFLRARKDQELWVKYAALGRGINPVWFGSSLEEEERFIAAKLEETIRVKFMKSSCF